MNEAKSVHWSQLADELGAEANEAAESLAEQGQKSPVESVTPPPPPRRDPRPEADAGVSSWRSLAGDFGLELPPEPEEPEVVEEAAVEESAVEEEAVEEEAVEDEPTTVDDEAEATDESPVIAASEIVEEVELEAPAAPSLFDEAEISDVIDESEPATASAPAFPSPVKSQFGASIFESEPLDSINDGTDGDPLVVPQEPFLDEVDGDLDEDSIENIDAKPTADAGESEEQEPGRRRRRRRRRRSGRPESGESRDEEPTARDAESEEARDTSEVAFGEGVIEALDRSEEDGEEKSTAESRRGRRRRRRRRSPDRSVDRESDADRETDEQAEPEWQSDSVGESDIDDEELDDDEPRQRGSDGGTGKHRKIPTWSEAVNFIVTANLAGRPRIRAAHEAAAGHADRTGSIAPAARRFAAERKRWTSVGPVSTGERYAFGGGTSVT